MCRLFIGASPDLWESQTRSVRMDGMVTSVRLEKMFWTVLGEIADKDELNIPQLLHQLYNESIDEGHDLGNFTSFLRVCCLRYLDLQLQGFLSKDPSKARLPEEILALEAEARKQREAARTASPAGQRKGQKYLL
ncbi:MAG: hypothetical protein DI629_17735 [Mesorhizobium amorphae]|nr:MAG: hypothetical protein DI629_17735 [Mesorhizobium amorphae]